MTGTGSDSSTPTLGRTAEKHTYDEHPELHTSTISTRYKDRIAKTLRMQTPDVATAGKDIVHQQPHPPHTVCFLCAGDSEAESEDKAAMEQMELMRRMPRIHQGYIRGQQDTSGEGVRHSGSMVSAW